MQISRLTNLANLHNQNSSDLTLNNPVISHIEGLAHLYTEGVAHSYTGISLFVHKEGQIVCILRCRSTLKQRGRPARAQRVQFTHTHKRVGPLIYRGVSPLAHRQVGPLAHNDASQVINKQKKGSAHSYIKGLSHSCTGGLAHSYRDGSTHLYAK